MQKTAKVLVLGCKVNQYDAHQIERLLETYGFEIQPQNLTPQLIVVHTCGVTAAAAQKSRQTIRRMQREAPESQIIVTGCAAHDKLTQVETTPDLRIPAGPDWLQHLAEQLEQHGLVPLHSTSIQTDAFAPRNFGNHTRAYLKVQDGCDIGCTYCIVPSLRKAPRDKILQTALEEATQLIQKGYREIVLTGVSVGLYGRTAHHTLAELLRQLAELPDMGRIRLSSLHPAELTPELLDVWASHPNIMPHLHLSLQSGADPILKAMRRGYTTAEYLDAVQRARSALDNPAFTTDLIVGFPGETEADFEATCTFCQTVGFSQMHIFTYSPRPGTLAAKMKPQIDGALATQRAAQLRQIGKKLALNYHQQFINQPVEILIEQIKNTQAKGYSKHYIPVHLPATTLKKSQIITLIPTRATPDALYVNI